MREITTFGDLRDLASQLAQNPFGHPSQVRTQVLVLQTCVDLGRLASPFGQGSTAVKSQPPFWKYASHMTYSPNTYVVSLVRNERMELMYHLTFQRPGHQKLVQVRRRSITPACQRQCFYWSPWCCVCTPLAHVCGDASTRPVAARHQRKGCAENVSWKVREMRVLEDCRNLFQLLCLLVSQHHWTM